MPNKSLLDPVLIAQLGNLQLRARRILDGLYSGHHSNFNRGHAQEFSEHRPYNPGDDLRGLDWKVFARTDRLVVRQYEEQTNVGATIVIDDSASMNFQYNGRTSKLDYARTLAAAAGYLIVSQHDAVGLVTAKKNLRPGTQRGHLEKYFECLDDIRAEGKYDFSLLNDSVASVVRKRSFVLIFSDLMENADKVIESVTALNARKHEVMVFQILDPAELDLPFDGPTIFEDMETGEKIKTEPEFIRDQYRQWVKLKLESIEHVFKSVGVDYLLLTSDTPFDKGLGAYLSWRKVRL